MTTTVKLPSFTEVLTIDRSGNGYPIFDLMVPNGPHHVGSSYIVFYTEDDNILDEYYSLRDDLDKVREFFVQHPECICSLSDVRQKYGTIEEVMVYNQLCHNLAYSMERVYACYAHYIDEQGQCHVFKRRDVEQFDPDLFRNMPSKGPSKALWQLHVRLSELHAENKIKPFVTYKGKCVEGILRARSKFAPTENYGEYALVMKKLEGLKGKLNSLATHLSADHIFVALLNSEGYIAKRDAGWIFSFEDKQNTVEKVEDGVLWLAPYLVDKWSNHLQASVKAFLQ